VDKIAVLIPCYNEEKTIAKVIEDFKKSLPDAIVYVYDNNSSDNTAEIAKKSGAVVRRETQQGKGFVLRRMFREINARCYLLVDGDDTYPAQSAPEMCAEILSGRADMVVGDRLSTTYYKENKRSFHGFGNSLVKFFINKLFASKISDVMTGYRAMSYLFVKSFPVLSRGFEIETEMTIHAVEKKLAVLSVPVEYRDRPEGSVSKLNTFTDGFKVIISIFRLYKNYKPFYFFGILSALLFSIALAFFIPVFITYINTSQVPKFPTLIVCGFSIIASIQCLFSGFILSTANQKNLQDFELRLYDIYKEYLENEKI